MRLSLAAVIPAMLVLSGCNTAGGPPFSGSAINPDSDPYPGVSVFPVGDVKLAQVYVPQNNPTNAKQPYIKNICADDFQQTKALAAIATKYANPSGTAALDVSENYTTAVNASVTGIPIHIVDVGASFNPTATTTIKYSGVQIYSVDDADLKTVWQNLGDACKGYFKTSGAFLVGGAVKAQSLDVEVKKNNDPSATAALKVGAVSPGFTLGGQSDSDVTLSGSNLFFEVTEQKPQ